MSCGRDVHGCGQVDGLRIASLVLRLPAICQGVVIGARRTVQPLSSCGDLVQPFCSEIVKKCQLRVIRPYRPSSTTYEMLPPATLSAVIGPALVIMTFPSQSAVLLSHVFSFGCSSSQIFFFWI